MSGASKLTGASCAGVVLDRAALDLLDGAQAQLQQLQRMRTLGAIAAGIGHDFNNLLMAIRGNVGLVLMDEKTDAATRARLDQVELAAMRASDLSQRLLALARPAEEKVALIDFNGVAQEAADLATRALRGKLVVTVKPSPEPPCVHMDFTQAVQAILNLCLNAGDAMLPASRGSEVKIVNEFVCLDAARAARMERADGETFVSCSVSDTGIGISPEVLPYLFTPFFTTKAKGKGAGLGLAMAHHAVRRAGGFIEVQTALGMGTTFRVLLPLAPRPLHVGETDFGGQSVSGN